ncbi:MAG: bifunctional oligoribonuclease/PAP phosphatase NrnA [Patescibacteria group bacterium]
MISNQLQGKIKILRDQLLSANRILVVSHLKPDGDAVGASLALKLGIQALGKPVEVACLDTPPECFSFLPHFFNIRTAFAPQDFDAVIIVDCGDWVRTGFFTTSELQIDWPRHLAVIDHHCIQNLTPGLHIVDPTASSSAELVFYVLKQWGIEITKDMATCLFAGISTDTGSFKHTNTNQEVLQLAGSLMEKGANLSKIERYVYADKDLSKLRLWGRVLQKMHRNQRWNILVAIITAQDLAECEATDEDLEGAVDLMRTVPNVKAVILGSERGAEFKFNLRTEDLEVDVSRLAALFGGGGHIKAAGFSLSAEEMKTLEG